MVALKSLYLFTLTMMTAIHQYIFEKCIRLMKAGSGDYNFYTSIYNKEEDKEWADITTFNREVLNVIKFMQNEGYIVQKHTSGMPLWKMLTQKGWDFTSFTDLQQTRQEEKEQHRNQVEKLALEVKILREQFFDYDKVKRRSKAAHVGMIVAVLISIFGLIVAIVKR